MRSGQAGREGRHPSSAGKVPPTSSGFVADCMRLLRADAMEPARQPGSSSGATAKPHPPKEVAGGDAHCQAHARANARQPAGRRWTAW